MLVNPVLLPLFKPKFNGDASTCVGHPPAQVNNGYLVRDLDPLAVVYNDASVLENFHAAEGFKMMLDPAFDILRVGMDGTRRGIETTDV